MSPSYQLQKQDVLRKKVTTYPPKSLPDSGLTHIHRFQPKFDFVVAERSKYIPNSGPPLAPIGILPAHDEDGIIEDIMNIGGSTHYIISCPHQPALRMAVKPERVREYVSARTFELWEYKQTQARNRMQLENLRHNIKAKERRRFINTPEKDIQSRAEATVKKKKQSVRPFGKRKKRRAVERFAAQKSLMASMSVGAGMGLGMVSTTSSHISQLEETSYRSPRRPGISTSSKQHGLAEALCSEPEGEIEGEERSIALDHQLDKAPRQNSLFGVNSFKSPLSSNSKNIPHKRSSSVSSSSLKSVTRQSAGPSLHVDSRHNINDRMDAIASISSLGAFEEYEKLEKMARQTNVEQAPGCFNQSLLPPSAVVKVNTPLTNKYMEIAKVQLSSAKLDPKCDVKAALYVRGNNDASAVRLDLSAYNSMGSSSMRRGFTSSSRHSERASDRGEVGSPAQRRSVLSSSLPSTNCTISPGLTAQDLDTRSDGASSDSEGSVEAIVNEKWRTVNGSEVQFYLIKREGDDSCTWEPAHSIDLGSIRDWNEVKRQKKITKEKKK
jgi:hypothetical protein